MECVNPRNEEKVNHRKLLDKYKKLKSDYFDAYLGLGLAALQSGQINKSIDNLTKALGINQSDRAYYSRGIAYYNQENYKEAVNDFKAAIEIVF